ncbi:hypothetical protein [Lactiplantibacillus paraplantarum]|uniref:hypothetical protein n=1 Tax=Lactiplantibacillus paraplantarum TaxID=60520 RepID=UPI0034E5452D
MTESNPTQVILTDDGIKIIKAQNTADNAASRVTNLNDPNLMSVIEKQNNISQFAGLTSQYNVIIQNAKDDGIDTTAVTTAYNNLNQFMANILADPNNASDIDRATYKKYQDAYNQELANTQNALQNNANNKFTSAANATNQAASTASQAFSAAQSARNSINNLIPYTHIAYANSADGKADFSVSDSNRIYIGMYVDFTATDSNDSTKYDWSLIKGHDGAQGTPGKAGVDGKTPYFHIAYADNATGTTGFSTIDSLNKPYIGQYTDYVQADATDPTKYLWTLIKGDKGADGDVGPKGDQGIKGPGGADGRTTYAHFAYANSQDGKTDFSTTDSNRKYIGFYSDFSSGDSTDQSKYAWSLIKGADGADGKDGVPGKAGADGKTPYFHIAYADSSDGNTNFSLDTPGSRKYIGSYTDFTQADNVNPALYSWQLVQGPKGDAGRDGVAGKDGVGIKSTQIMYVQSTSGTTAPTTGWAAQVPTLIKGQYLWTQTTWLYTDNTGEAGYTVSYNAKDGNTGANGIAGKDGVGIKSTVIEYSVSSNGVTKPTTGWSTAIPSIAPGQFMWTRTMWLYTDRTNEVGYSVAQAGETGPKGDKGLQGLQGPQGNQGIKGPAGADGKSSYTHIAYGTSNSGAGFTQTPSTLTTYIGMYVDFTATDSNDPTKYSWSLIKGADGANGAPGKAGADGKTPYFHQAWADSSDGTTNFSTTVSLGKKYLGTYTDYVAADSTDPTIYKWTELVGAIQVGGRNLYLNSKAIADGYGINSSATVTVEHFDSATNMWHIVSGKGNGDRVGIYFIGYANEKMPNKSDWAYSADVKGKGKTTWFGIEAGDHKPIVGTVGSEWSRISQTGHFDNNEIKTIVMYFDSTDSPVDVYIKLPKLETGNMPTDWTPAPEDLATQSQIIKLNNDINLNVKKGDLLSQINLQAGNILISSGGKSGGQLSLSANTIYFDSDNPVIIPSANIDTLLTRKKLTAADISANTFSTNNGTFVVDKYGAITAKNMTLTGGTLTTPTINGSTINGGTLNMQTDGLINSPYTGIQQTADQFYHPWTLNTGQLTIGQGYISSVSSGTRSINGVPKQFNSLRGTLSASYLKFTNDYGARTYIDADMFTYSNQTNDTAMVAISAGGVGINMGTANAPALTISNGYIDASSSSSYGKFGAITLGYHAHTINSDSSLFFESGHGSGNPGINIWAKGFQSLSSRLSTKRQVKLLDDEHSNSLLLGSDTATFQYNQDTNADNSNEGVIIDDVNTTKHYSLPDELITRDGKAPTDLMSFIARVVSQNKYQARLIEDLQIRLRKVEIKNE